CVRDAQIQLLLQYFDYW
nr:immunoglobulin heavy chain junction region [Macaca mulatta]MOV87189.1 immunoglobulin heavy chain junction region [Macaca mulatta]MOV87455.1 immunoglobulin heavy chain junction region [Macaca mulatta]MOV87492.1 immunoglobulin heavy chain junction region [Macaca mulatta]MOV87654.1 immunoglobulin heavy chain junction region [Macaca mulatta]